MITHDKSTKPIDPVAKWTLPTVGWLIDRLSLVHPNIIVFSRPVNNGFQADVVDDVQHIFYRSEVYPNIARHQISDRPDERNKFVNPGIIIK